MRIFSQHSWEIKLSDASKIQSQLAAKLYMRPPVSFQVDNVCGADVSNQRGSNLVYAAAVVLSFPGLQLEEIQVAVEEAVFPYVPGFLSFREGPVLLTALQKITGTPDMFFFNGQGLAHPRGLGLASHLGLFLQKPTIGVAKKKLVGGHGPVGPTPGAYSHLQYQGKLVGNALRTKKKTHPVYVSPGHLIDTHTATGLALQSCSRYRLPDPIRYAHLYANRIRTGGRLDRNLEI